MKKTNTHTLPLYKRNIDTYIYIYRNKGHKGQINIEKMNTESNKGSGTSRNEDIRIQWYIYKHYKYKIDTNRHK